MRMLFGISVIAELRFQPLPNILYYDTFQTVTVPSVSRIVII